MPYKCNVCGKQFPWRKSYDNHMYLHSGYRPYKCRICEREFIYKDSHVKHLESHSRGTAQVLKTEKDLQKMIKCLLCERKFFSKGNMVRHIRRIHKVGDSNSAFQENDME